MAETDHVVEKFLNIKFQTGNRKEFGFNGVDEIIVIEILIDRLKSKCVGMSKINKNNCFRAIDGLDTAKICLNHIRGDDENKSGSNLEGGRTRSDKSGQESI